MTLEEAQQKYEECDKAYAQLKKRAPELRHEFLCSRASNATGDVEPASQKAAQQQLRTERQRREARHLRQVLGNAPGGAISKIEVATGDSFEEVSVQADVEHHTMAMCSARFRLTEDTPPMTEPLRSELGYLGITAAARQILAGTYVPPPGVDTITRQFLSALKASAPLDPANRISCEITRQDFQQHWRRAKERTSSSLSGLHYGHYKAAATSNYLSEIHALMTELAVTGGTPFERWQSGLSVMLEKKKGVIQVDKLRAILLMEADFNFYNGLMFAKRMMERAELNNWIPREIYGGRKNHEAIEVAMNRRFLADITRQRRTPLAIASVDAQTCYDRIAHSIGSIATQGWQVDPQAIITMLLTIQGMKFFLRTAFGDSTTYFGGSSTVPFQGGCQGNKGTPALWLVVSVALIRMMHTLGLVTRLRAAMTATTVVFAGFLFVDDTDLIAFSESKDDSFPQVTARLQQAVQAWHGGLRASGGALKPEKCSWSIADFTWSEGKWKYATVNDTPGDIVIPDLEGHLQPITRLESWEAVRAVGVYQAMDGTMREQIQALKEKADTWGDKIKTSWLPRDLAHQGKSSMIWAALKYPLPACTITEKEGEMITKELYKSLLPKLGANRNFPHVYRYAPASLQGLELPLIYVEQEIGHLRQILTHGAINSTTGSLMRISLEQGQLEVGIGTPFLEASFDSYGFLLTDIWWKTVWEFIWKHGIRLTYPDQFLPTLQRTGDVFIMDLLCSRTELTQSEILSCNRCRLALEAITLADITNGAGSRITDDAATLQPVDSRPSQWIWPREHPSRSRDLNAWRKGLRLISSHNFILDCFQRLGNWTYPSHKQWDWYHDPAAGELYHRTTELWEVYTPSSHRRTRHRWWERSEVTLTLPATANRATAWIDQYGRAHFGGSAPSTLPIPSPLYDTIRQFINSWDDSWPLVDATFPDQLESLVQSILVGTAHGCCDGSYMPELSTELGAAAWIVEDPITNQAIHGTTQTTGEEQVVNAYRSELQGIHSILFMLTAVCTFFHITAGAITIGCDNLAGVDRSNDDWLKVNQTTKHADLVRAIRRLKASLPIKVRFVHVDGHQDRNQDVHSLPRLAQLNIAMDHRAKACLISLISSSAPPLRDAPLRGEGWLCLVNGIKITSDPAPVIRKAVFGHRLQQHLQARNLLSPIAFQDVDWDAIELATAHFPPLYRLWMTKHVSGFFAIGKMMKHWGFWEHQKCPCCSHVSEDKVHLLTCPEVSCVARWEQSVQGLREWLQETDTAPDIQYCLVNALAARRVTQSFQTFGKGLAAPAAVAQDSIGWMHLTEGKISRQWRQVQSAYYHSTQSKRSASKWAMGLVTTLLSMTHAQWTHRNNILHARDAQGLRIQEGQELDTAITLQFQSGLEGLHPNDYHLIERGRERVLHMTGPGKLSWLSSIRIAREHFMSQAAKETESMRNLMTNYFTRG
jgi:hypothetical protein